MRKTRVVLALSALSILGAVFFGCATAKPLAPRDFRVGELREGWSQAEVERTLGAPQEVRPGEVWVYPGMEVRFSSKGTVAGIVLTDPRLSTDRGLHPGDSAQRLLVLHGSPYRVNGAPWKASAYNLPPALEGETWTYCLPRDPVCEHVLNVEFGAEKKVRSIFVGWVTK